MASGTLRESTPGFYVGLSKDAEILKVALGLDDITADPDPSIVRIGYISTMVQDYEEVWSYGAGLEHDKGDCEACEGEPSTDADPDTFLAYWHPGGAQGHWSSPNGCHRACPMVSCQQGRKTP